jgi:hypothetical protein
MVAIVTLNHVRRGAQTGANREKLSTANDAKKKACNRRRHKEKKLVTAEDAEKSRREHREGRRERGEKPFR